MVLSNEKYKSSNWFKRFLQVGVFSGLGLIGYDLNANAQERYPKQVKEQVQVEEQVKEVKIEESTKPTQTLEETTKQVKVNEQEIIPKGNYDLFIENNQIIVLFPQGIDTLNGNTKKSLESKLDSLNNLEGFNIGGVEGYASIEGDSIENVGLSYNRANNIAGIVNDKLENVDEIAFRRFGPTNEFGEYTKNRRVVINYSLEEPKVKKVEEVPFYWGISANGSKVEGGINGSLGFDTDIFGGSFQLGLYYINSLDVQEPIQGNPMGRNGRYLVQEKETRKDGLIPSMGGRISAYPFKNKWGLELGAIAEFRKIGVTEKINEEVRNSDGSPYKIGDNYVKDSNEGPRTSGYAGLVSKFEDYSLKAGIEFGKHKPRYSIGFTKRIGKRGK